MHIHIDVYNVALANRDVVHNDSLLINSVDMDLSLTANPPKPVVNAQYPEKLFAVII